jgi:hypothetical protein
MACSIVFPFAAAYLVFFSFSLTATHLRSSLS